MRYNRIYNKLNCNKLILDPFRFHDYNMIIYEGKMKISQTLRSEKLYLLVKQYTIFLCIVPLLQCTVSNLSLIMGFHPQSVIGKDLQKIHLQLLYRLDDLIPNFFPHCQSYLQEMYNNHV